MIVLFKSCQLPPGDAGRVPRFAITLCSNLQAGPRHFIAYYKSPHSQSQQEAERRPPEPVMPAQIPPTPQIAFGKNDPGGHRAQRTHDGNDQAVEACRTQPSSKPQLPERDGRNRKASKTAAGQ